MSLEALLLGLSLLFLLSILAGKASSRFGVPALLLFLLVGLLYMSCAQLEHQLFLIQLPIIN